MLSRVCGHRSLVSTAAVAALACAFFVSRPASAKTAIGADLDLGFPLHSRGDSGGGFGIRLGQELHIPLATFTPEIGFTYHNFSGDDGPKIYRGIAGARLGIGEVFRIGPMAHLGFGHFVPAYGDNRNAFTFDAGGFLDLTIIPFLNFGVHAAYNHVAADYTSGSYAFATVGLDAALVF
jgi:hypothetical protein